MFRYLSAEDICKFFDKFEDEVILMSGLSSDELAELSKSEINELLSDLFEYVVITKDNIHLYYESMSDQDLLKYKDVLHIVFGGRYSLVVNHFKEIGFLKDTGHGFDYDLMHYRSDILVDFNTVHYSKSISFFGIKDMLKPIDEYIAEIKAGKEYQEYMATSLSMEEKRAYRTGEMPNSPNYKKQCAINRLRG